MFDPFAPEPKEIRAPGSVGNLQSRVTSYAREAGVSIERLNQRLRTEVFLGLLGRAQTLGIISMYLAKGGMALELRFGIRARASGDLDVGIAAKGEALVDVFERVLAVGFHDFTFTMRDTPTLLENVQTYRIKVKIEYRGRSFGTLDVDLNEASLETATTIQSTGLLVALGLPGPLEIPLLDLNIQIAQKLHAATEPDRQDYTNRRHRDLLDVLIICQDPKVSLDMTRLRKVAIDEFARRPHNSHWPPIFTLPAAWRDELSRDAQRVGFLTSDSDVLARQFVEFIAEIEESQ
jgi:hypothetical protein